MIRNIRDLAVYVGVEPVSFENFEEGGLARRIRNAVYRYTDCGCVFDSDEDGVVVAGYAEGADAECPDHRLNYPFTKAEWDTELECADLEGCEMWHLWNDDDGQPDEAQEWHDFDPDC
jgi:hypothetical protein